MGDMADMAMELGLEQMMDAGYGIGFEPDDVEYIRRGQPNKLIKCKYCGERGLTWHSIGDKWRLVSKENGVHSCKEYRTTKQYARFEHWWTSSNRRCHDAFS